MERMIMDYEWDTEKSEATRRLRGFGFEIIEDLDWDFALCVGVQSVDYEERELWLGPIGKRLYAVVTTQRNEKIRIISLRHATQVEIQIWRNEFHNG